MTGPMAAVVGSGVAGLTAVSLPVQLGLSIVVTVRGVLTWAVLAMHHAVGLVSAALMTWLLARGTGAALPERSIG